MEIATRGFALRHAVLSKRRLTSLLQECKAQGFDRARIGSCDLLSRLPGLRRRLRSSSSVRDFVEPVLGATAFPVRGRYFDKSPQANWAVLWHQDLTTAVKRKVPVPGYGPWSKKAGIDHVQPPAAVLEEMLALRFHLDPASSEAAASDVLVMRPRRRGVINVEFAANPLAPPLEWYEPTASEARS